MYRNKITEKLVHTLGIGAILFFLSSLPVSSQNRYPSAAAIEKARTQFKAKLRSLQNNYYHNQISSSISNHLSPEKKQAQNNFVNAWQKVNPAIAPFLGSWIGNEEQAWGIHPSNKAGSVCLIKIQPEGLSLEIGTVTNNSIYTNKGKVFIKEGDYLGFGTIKNNQFLTGGILHNSFTKLQNPYSFRNIDGQSPSNGLLRTYTDAGCTASLPSKNIASNSSKSELPSQELINTIRKQTINPNYSQVEYSFFEFDLNNDGNKDAIVYETGRHCGMTMCYFHVFLNTGNQYRLLWGQNGLPTYNAKVAILKDSNSGLFNIAIPRYSLNPLEYDKVKGWRTYKFNGKEYGNSGGVSNSINYKTIIDFEKAQRFNLAVADLSSKNSMLSDNQTIRIPDSFKLTLDNGMKTEFVKGQDSYYTWFVTNYVVSNTCLGLTNNKNPAKIKLAPYGCNSKKKAKKWEIVMANNNTGYKVKLPNTSHCLANNVGVVDCSNSQATVINLTPQQLKDFTVNTRP